MLWFSKIHHWVRGQKTRWTRWPPIGCVTFGNLRRLTPISQIFGFDRGLPIDRYYIEKFLQQYNSDIKGRVLEVGDSSYTCKFGDDRVSKSDILHATADNPKATIIADLTDAGCIPSSIFDCVILIQTLPFIYDFQSALKTIYRIITPGGTLLATFNGISQISRYDMERWGDYWRFTTKAAQRFMEELFPESDITVKAYGNVLAAISFMHGLAAQELRPEELDYHDPDYELLITVRAVKPECGV